jgi:hypothetical protein
VQDVIPLQIHRQDLVVSMKLGGCTKKLIPNASFLIFGLNVVNITRCVLFNLAGFSFNETVMLLPANP